ncbi:hypothetical protein [Erwinia sp. V71]|uniref:hypothetical protein n=1 Tax=Erwinia sp. V71 TaxID=3369424 RepID=UPI003F5F4071
MIKNSNADVINALVKAEALILLLSTHGVKVNSVTLRNSLPVIPRLVRQDDA